MPRQNNTNPTPVRSSRIVFLSLLLFWLKLRIYIFSNRIIICYWDISSGLGPFSSGVFLNNELLNIVKQALIDNFTKIILR